MTIQITSLAVTDATLSDRAVLLAEQLNLELKLPDAEKAQLILTPTRLEIRYPQLGARFLSILLAVKISIDVNLVGVVVSHWRKL